MSVEIDGVIQPIEQTEEDGSFEVINPDIDIVVKDAIATTTLENTFTVEAQIQEWVLTSDDIYIIQQYGAVPDWLNTLIMDVAAAPDGTIIDDVNDLQAQINAINDGFTNEVYSVIGDDYTRTTDFESLKSSYEDSDSVIVEINDTYASKDYVQTTSWNLTAAYINEGHAASWLESSVSTIADVAYSAARSVNSLNASIDAVDSYASLIAGDVEVLKKQVDGEVVTWFVANADYGDESSFNTIGPVLPDGSVNPDCTDLFDEL